MLADLKNLSIVDNEFQIKIYNEIHAFFQPPRLTLKDVRSIEYSPLVYTMEGLVTLIDVPNVDSSKIRIFEIEWNNPKMYQGRILTVQYTNDRVLYNTVLSDDDDSLFISSTKWKYQFVDSNFIGDGTRKIYVSNASIDSGDHTMTVVREAETDNVVDGLYPRDYFGREVELRSGLYRIRRKTQG
jgi:hypothetical protein